MLWFKHTSDMRISAQMRKIEQKLGEAGYARALKLLEVVAQNGGIASDFSPMLDLTVSPTDLGYLASEWGVGSARAQKTLQVLAEVSFIDPEKWKGHVVYVPGMLKALDEWTRRQRRRRSDSGEGQE